MTRYIRMTYRCWVARVSSPYKLLLPNAILSDDLVCTVILLYYLSFF